MSTKQLSIAITGAGGAGVISCGELLLQAWAGRGGRGLLRKAYGPQIRGGESAALLKLTDNEHYAAPNHYDLLVALDWNNFSRFEDEIHLGPDSWVLCEAESELPAAVSAAGCLLAYVQDTQRGALPHLAGLQTELSTDALIMDAVTRRNLEIESNLSGQTEHTLTGIMDQCATPMGSRLLRRWLQ